jgi:protein-tyrosine phosphatase
LLPFFLFAWGVWHLQRLLSGVPAWHEVSPGVYLGRRLQPKEVPAGIRFVVDLTAEFPEPADVRVGREYRSLPTLDGFAPDEYRLRKLVAELATYPGPILIHCANGSGRSGTVAAALLIARGLASDARTAVTMVKTVRGCVRLKPAQWRALEHVVLAGSNV